MKKKKGSALLFVVIMLSIMVAVCTGLLEISMISLKQSKNYYNKNSAYYYADNAMEKALYYIDLAADNARDEANKACFLPNGLPNLENEEINKAYNKYLNSENQEEALDIYKGEVKEIFMKEYKERIHGFFEDGKPLEIEGLGSVKWAGDDGDAEPDRLKQIIEDMASDENASVKIYRYKEAPEDIKGTGNAEEYENLPLDGDDSLPVETIYVSANLPKQNVTRCVVSTFEMNPFGYDKKVSGVKINSARVMQGYNKALDYPLISGRNIIAVNGKNTFTVDGDVYAMGTSNDLNANVDSTCFGGILAGMDSINFKGLRGTWDDGEARINATNLMEEQVPMIGGNIRIKGSAYSGGPVKKDGSEDDLSNLYLTGGFVKTMGEDSSIEIEGDLYCHSIVTEESSHNGTISVGKSSGTGNCYIADNVSLYGRESSINIMKSLIGFETGDSDTNYNSSPSIVMDAASSRLNVGKNVVLFGSVSVDNLLSKDSSKNFRMIETSAINPNFMAYSYVNGTDDFAQEYSLGGRSIYMFDRNKYVQLPGEDAPRQHPEKAVTYILDYMKKSILNPVNFDYQYNFGDGIINIPGLKLNDDPNDTSYFPYVMIANNSAYTSRNLLGFYDSTDDIVSLKDTINSSGHGLYPLGGDGIEGSPYKSFDTASLERVLRDEWLPAKKNEALTKMLFRDKGLKDANGFEDYFSFDDLKGDIELGGSGRDYYILISKGDINIDPATLRGVKNILLVSGGNIIIDCSDDVTLTGNIIARGDILIKGKSMELKWDKDVSKELMNIIDNANVNDSLSMFRFFSKGVSEGADKEIQFAGSFDKTVKTNIRVLNRAQLIK